MKFLYSPQQLSRLERAEETCWLLTNGLGGFSSLTAAFSAARCDHSLLMSCEQAPNKRRNLIHRLSEQL